MRARRLLIPFALASLAGHALVIALATGVDWTGRSRQETVLTVDLQAPPGDAARPDPPGAEDPPPEAGGKGPGDSVDLRAKKSRYDTYLRLIRRKIERHWSDPPQALPGKKEGSAVIRFTIDANGALRGVRIANASGSPALDEGTLAAVRAAAPFDPLPAEFNLARLHITATFNYR
ncbi:MAG: energy transducer TonB [Thermodesulfobacteriota bacterium]